MSTREGVWEPGLPGRARRGRDHFATNKQGGPAESRMDGQDWLTRDYGETRWRRWRWVAKGVWELTDE